MTNRTSAEAEALVPQFQFEKLLNQDQAGRRISLLGSISSQPALLIVERAPFSTEPSDLSALSQSLFEVQNLGNNDIYLWFMASSTNSSVSTSEISSGQQQQQQKQPPNLKINLIFPCTQKHVEKYSQQGLRLVVETSEIYSGHVKPFMQKQREEGRLNWVFNIIDGKSEQESVIYREHGEQGFLILPDLNWDRKTLTSMHILGIVERRDIWSLRDLRKEHVTWLKHMRRKILDVTVELYPEVEEDQLKCYVHYQPTYYHFHIHVVHVMLEAGKTQAVGKAFGLDMLISQLENMKDGSGLAQLDISYDIGEASELWTEVFQPLKGKEKRRKKCRDEQDSQTG